MKGEWLHRRPSCDNPAVPSQLSFASLHVIKFVVDHQTTSATTRSPLAPPSPSSSTTVLPRYPSGRKGTTLEEDQSELELAAEIWCRLGKERLKRSAKRATEECCGYVTELLPQSSAARRRVHPRLWRWLAVAEGLWGQAVASMVAPESQEKPLQDELR